MTGVTLDRDPSHMKGAPDSIFELRRINRRQVDRFDAKVDEDGSRFEEFQWD